MPMKIMTILGTRPEIIRLSLIINKLDLYCNHILVHTGQNFEDNLSSVFFNVTDGISESEWYTITTELSNDGISVGIQNEEGVLIQSLSEPLSLDSNKTLVLMVTNNADSAVVLKDFQVHDDSATIEPTSQIVHLPAPPAKSLLLFCIAVVIIAAVLIITAAAINIKRVRKGI